MRAPTKLLVAGVFCLFSASQALVGEASETPPPLPGESEYAERAQRLLSSAIETGDILGTAQAQHALAEHMKTLSLWPQALVHADLAREAAREIDDPHTRLAIDITYASILSQLDRTAEGTDILLRSLQRARQLSNIEQEQWALLGLSSTYVSARQLEQAEEFALQGLALTRNSGDRVQEVRFLSNLGLIAWTAGDAAKAGAYIQQATTVETEWLPSDVHKTLILASITLAGTRGEDSAARARQVIAQARQDGSRYMEAFATEQLGQILCGQGEFEDGLEAFATADPLFRESDRLGDLRRLYERWAECLEAAGQFELALRHQREAMTLLDQAHERRQHETLQAHDIAFRTEQRLTELARLAGEEQALQARVSRQRMFIGWFIAGVLFLVGALYVFILHQRQVHRERLRSEIAEREQMQQQLLHAEKMKAVGRLASGVAHDFNNVLNVVIGYAARRDKLDDIKTAEQMLAGIEAAARRGAAVAEKLLGLARPGSPNGAIFDAAAAIHESMPMLHQTFDDRVRVEAEITTQATPIQLDRSQFDLILLNIAANARDAMPDGGTFSISLVRDGRYAEFTLSDNGSGMSREVRARLFEPFFTTKAPGEGHGLGLVLIKNLISEAGGSIIIDSAPDQGTTVRIRIPLTEKTEKQA